MENPTRREIGLELYHAERSIGIGRRAIKELQEQYPVDYDAIDEQRGIILEARLARNGLRQQLAAVKATEAGAGVSWTWMKGR